MDYFRIIRRYGDTDFVTTLRALAAMMVVVVHAGAFTNLGSVGENITQAGRYGVQVFFVISGFSIATTLTGSVKYRSYLVRRLFRIIPLYWMIILLVASLTLTGVLPSNHWSNYFGTAIDAYNLLMHFSFLSCFDHRIGTTILGVEWTIPVEVFWYLVLPGVILWMSKRHRHVLALILSIIAIGVTQLVARAMIPDNPGLFAKWFPTSHGPYFLLGVMAHQLRQQQSHWLHQKSSVVLGSAWVIAMTCLCVDAPALGVISAILCVLTIGLFQPSEKSGLAKAATWGPFLFVGSISYSLYLTHFPVILLLKQHFELAEGMLLFMCSIAISLVLSTLFYISIERPMNDFGKRFCSRLYPHSHSDASLTCDSAKLTTRTSSDAVLRVEAVAKRGVVEPSG